MNCDENKVQDIVAQMTKMYRDLVEIKKQIEEKNKELVTLTAGITHTNINSVNYKLDDSNERLRLLIYEIETKAATIMQLNNIKGSKTKKSPIPTIVPSKNKKVSRFAMAVTEEEALTAITSNIKKNKEITNMVNSEIIKELQTAKK